MGGVGACSFFCCSLIAPPRPPPPHPLSSPSKSMSMSMFKRNKTNRPQRILTTCQINLNPPPYPVDALEPHMSRETVEYHWGRHHRAHVDALNRHIAGTELDAMPLPDIILAAYNKGDPLPSFHHASEVWNHDFFWQSMKPGGRGYPSGVLVELINRDFGSLDRMLKEFSSAAFTQFGSGWAWLVYKANRLDVENAVNPRPSEKDNKLLVAKTPNAVNPLVWDYSPLLAIDVWEHAYYLDFENRRENYVSTFLEKLVSWEVVTHRLEMAIARAAERAREEERRREEEEGIEIGGSEAVEMYLDSDNDEVEAAE